MPTARPATGADTPRLLSVVVAMYEVEDFLVECLDSLLGQTYAALEIILVDDGSTDATADIARGYARRDERIAIVTQLNVGPGAARNAGARRATGEFLTFVDSDDTVPQRAYERLVRTLLDTGSDLAVGSVEELVGKQYRVPGWLVPLHRRERLRVTADEAPDILHNAFAWDKVFRRSFWTGAGLAFPEGVYYEDHLPMTRAYLAARSLDILPEPVYRWRTRTDGSSITQRRHELRNLADAIAAKREVTELISDHATSNTRRYWHSVMFDDLRPYARCVEDSSDEYWATLRDGVRGLLAYVPEADLAAVAVRVRLMILLMAEDRRRDLEALVRQLRDKESRPALVRRDGRDQLDVAALPGDGSEAPAGLLDLALVDRGLLARLVEVTVQDAATVRLTGWVQLLGVCERSSPPSPSLSIVLRLRDRWSRRDDLSVPAVFAGEWSGVADRPSRGVPPPWAFSVVVPTLHSTPGSWALDIVVSYDDVTVIGPFTGASKQALAALRTPAVALSWGWGPGLQLDVP